MSDRDADNLAVTSVKITLYLVFGIFILWGLLFKNHPKTALLLLAISGVIIFAMTRENRY